ncbi:MAG: DUF1015 domain-containing protein [Flavobacteriales bacterium]|nr:DUF1015 domain-containing protein [Flavobacteriales bacterium]
MARVIPFRGIHPRPDIAARAVSRPYDSYSNKEIKEILRTNEDSFMNVIRPEVLTGEKYPSNSPKLFAQSKWVYEHLYNKGVFQQDDKPSFYVYTQHIGRASFTGIMGCASVEDYDSGVIRIHEQTIASREKLLKEYLAVCDINAEPVCFTYPRSGSLELLTEIIKQNPPLLEFEEGDGKRHQLWRVDQPEWTAKFSEKLGLLDHIYIADGHHRSASSVLLAHEKWAEGGRITGKEPWNYFLGIFFPDDQLKIYEFNRIVKNLGDKGVSQFLEDLSDDFEVHFKEQIPIKPEQQGHFGMCLGGFWYKLVYRHRRSSEAVAALDVSILSDKILAPLLGIRDLRNDDRINFVPGSKGPQELERLVNTGKYNVAFSLFPVTGQEFYAISDQGKTMPPKSTYVVPKLLSGLLIYSLSD